MSSTATCSECYSEFLLAKSAIKNLCPECSYLIYGYDNCQHSFENGKCIHCLWDGTSTHYTDSLRKQLEEEED